MGSPRDQLYEGYDEQGDTQEENGEGELGFGDRSRGGETAARETVATGSFPRQKADEDVPDREAEGDHEQGDERHGFWDIPCIVRSLHLRAHDAHERDTYDEANKQDHGAHLGTRLLQFLHDFFIKKSYWVHELFPLSGTYYAFSI
jgi:hypothetical protein